MSNTKIPFPTSQEEFLDLVDRFLEATGTPPTRLGHAALGDKTFVARLRGGRRCTLDVAARVVQWMRENDHIDQNLTHQNNHGERNQS